MRHVIYNPSQDYLNLRRLARNKKAGSYPTLRTKVAEITVAYKKYSTAGGNGALLTPLGLTDPIKGHLVQHYKHPPKSLVYINILRDETAAHTCPMCGSLSCGTLDHVLPKEHFPEFSLLSKNLVPACLCNSKRGSEYKSADGARVLHPYFDSIMSDRLVGCAFRDHGIAPSINIVNLLPRRNSTFKSVQFHIETIVQKTAIKGSIRQKWATLIRKPALAVRGLSKNPESLSRLRQTLIEEQSMLDDAHQSKNNWNSIFLTGLLEQPTLEWLYRTMTSPGRTDNDPLIAP